MQFSMETSQGGTEKDKLMSSGENGIFLEIKRTERKKRLGDFVRSYLWEKQKGKG